MLLLQPENEDELKKRQLMELALLNGTYRGNGNNFLAAATRLNNNNNSLIAVNNNHNNNNNIGLLMMAAGPPFCKSLTFRLH